MQLLQPRVELVLPLLVLVQLRVGEPVVGHAEDLVEEFFLDVLFLVFVRRRLVPPRPASPSDHQFSSGEFPLHPLSDDPLQLHLELHALALHDVHVSLEPRHYRLALVERILKWHSQISQIEWRVSDWKTGKRANNKTDPFTS